MESSIQLAERPNWKRLLADKKRYCGGRAAVDKHHVRFRLNGLGVEGHLPQPFFWVKIHVMLVSDGINQLAFLEGHVLHNPPHYRTEHEFDGLQHESWPYKGRWWSRKSTGTGIPSFRQ